MPAAKQEYLDYVTKYIPAATRNKIPLSDFAGPNRSFPVRVQADVDNAARLVGHAANPDRVKRNIKSIARRKGLKLPDAWEKEDGHSAKKVAGDTIEFHKFVNFSKADEEQHLVYGIASTGDIDDQGEVIEPNALEAALPDYLKWGNIREMHQPSAVGVIVSAKFNDKKQLEIAAKIVDPLAWEKVKAGVYKGFSVGGQILNSIFEKINGKLVRKITALALREISLVDRGANPNAQILLWKGSNMNSTEQEQIAAQEQQPVTTTPEAPAQPVASGILAKASGTDPDKIVALMQSWRNELELAGNTDAAQMITDSIGCVIAAKGDQQSDEANGGEDGNLLPEMPAGGMATSPDGTNSPDQVQMAAQILDLVKAGRTLSSASMGHAKVAHDSLENMAKMAGTSFCKGEDMEEMAGGDDDMAAGAAIPARPMPPPAVKATRTGNLHKASLAEQPGDIAKLSGQLEKFASAITQSLDAFEKRLTRIEAQPMPGGPVLSGAVEKSLMGGRPQQTDPTDAEVTRLESQLSLAKSSGDHILQESLSKQLANLQIYQSVRGALRK